MAWSGSPFVPSAPLAPSAPPAPSGAPDLARLEGSALTASRQIHEIIRDDTERVVCVLDNSSSMREKDGKIIKKDERTGKWKKVGGNEKGWFAKQITRWEEAVHKCSQVAVYNFKRGVHATYYLLNPKNNGNWILGQDKVEIDPRIEHDEAAVLNKLKPLFSEDRVSGLTPLSVTTEHIISTVQNFSSRICYIIFTDGEPNNDNKFFDQSKTSFEGSIRKFAEATGSLSSMSKLFLTINLCTNEDEVVKYYNELDGKLKSELSGMDVLDDLEAEAEEVKQWNTFITYCDELHVCRMAGCHSQIADNLDEKKLDAYDAVQLVKESLKLDIGSVPCQCGTWNKVTELVCSGCGEANKAFDEQYNDEECYDEREKHLTRVKNRNIKVYDPLSRTMKDLVDVAEYRKIITPPNEKNFSWFCILAIVIFVIAIILGSRSGNYGSHNDRNRYR